MGEPPGPFVIKGVEYAKDGGTTQLYFEDASGREHVLHLPQPLVLHEHSRDLWLDRAPVPRRSDLEAAVLRGLHGALYDLPSPSNSSGPGGAIDGRVLAPGCVRQVVAWVDSDEYVAWPAVRAEQSRAEREVYEDARRARDLDLAGRRRVAAARGAHADGDRCPRCGFGHAWDGSACGHCRPAGRDERPAIGGE